jgi:hypothetical protein
MVTERDEMIHAAAAWTQKKSIENFWLLWAHGFRTKNPFFKLWRIFRNTVNGRYAEIAEKQYRAW